MAPAQLAHSGPLLKWNTFKLMTTGAYLLFQPHPIPKTPMPTPSDCHRSLLHRLSTIIDHKGVLSTGASGQHCRGVSTRSHGLDRIHANSSKRQMAGRDTLHGREHFTRGLSAGRRGCRSLPALLRGTDRSQCIFYHHRRSAILGTWHGWPPGHGGGHITANILSEAQAGRSSGPG